MSHAAPTLAPSVSTSAPATTSHGHCLNCRQPLAGPFCHQCGQSAHVPARITTRYLLHDIPHSIWHVDHGIVYSLREMTLRPGRSILRYLNGERKPFFPPISLMVLVGGISVFLTAKLHIIPYDAHPPGISPRLQAAQMEVIGFVQKYQTWISMLILPISASLATPLLRRSTGRTWAEQLAAATLLNSTVAALNLPLIPFLALWSGQPGVQHVGNAMLLISLFYKTRGYAQFQALGPNPPSTASGIVRGLMISFGEYLVLMLLGMLGLVAVVMLHKSA